MLAVAADDDATVHDGGTYICMEGPQFSTRAESHFYRKTVDPVVIGMTALPEAKLAREAEMCYAIVATGTDYDCWHESEADVTVEAIIAVLHQNAYTARAIVKKTAAALLGCDTRVLPRPAVLHAQRVAFGLGGRFPPNAPLLLVVLVVLVVLVAVGRGSGSRLPALGSA